MTHRPCRALVVAARIVLATTLISIGFVVPRAGDAGAQVEVGTGGLRLLSRTVETTDGFELDLQLPGIVEPDDVLVMAVHQRVADRSAFRSTLDGVQVGAIMISRIFAVQELEPTTRGRVTLDIDADSLAEIVPESGVYPVSVELRTANQTPLGRLMTHLVRVVDDSPDPTRVALALVMDVAPNTTSTGDIDSSDTTAAWMDAIISRPDLPVTVQPTPWLLDEFNTDPRMRRFINRLDTAEVIASPYVPIDLRALELAGVIERADALYARGVETLTTVLGSEPITTRFLSRSEPTLSEARLLHTRGVRDLVARADRVDIDGPVEIQTGEGTLRALTVPSWFSDASPDDPVLGAHHLLAELAVMAMATDHETSAVVLFGTDTPFDDTFIDELLAGLTASSVIDPVSLSEAAAVPQLVNGIGLPISLSPPDGDDTTLPGDLALYLEAVDDLSSYRSMISDEDTHHVYDELNDRLLIGLGRGVSATDRNILARSTIAQVRVETGAVEAPPLRGVNLTSRQATAPFSFRNNASYPLRVEVRFLADKARFVDFDDGETTTLVLEPGITNWEFRVQALAAGSFPLRIEMFSPDGALELDAVDLTMRSTVPSGVGVALTIGAVVVLVAWWGRDLLRGRRVAA